MGSDNIKWGTGSGGVDRLTVEMVARWMSKGCGGEFAWMINGRLRVDDGKTFFFYRLWNCQAIGV